MTLSSSFFPSVIRRIHIHVSMQGYIRNAIIVIMIGITASCDSVIISAYDAVALNRNICANSTPLSTACHKTISYIFTTTEVIRIRGRTTSHPVAHINCFHIRILIFVEDLGRTMAVTVCPLRKSSRTVAAPTKLVEPVMMIFIFCCPFPHLTLINHPSYSRLPVYCT